MKKLILPLLLLVAFGMLAAVESDPSAVVGYVKYPCYPGLNFVALPMEAGFTFGSEAIAAYNGADEVDNMSVWVNDGMGNEYWDTTTNQGGNYFDPDPFVGPGSVLYFTWIGANAFDFYSIGSLPAPAQYTIEFGGNAVMIPLNRSDLNAVSLFAASVGPDEVDNVSLWINDGFGNEYWDTTINQGGDYFDPDPSLTIGQPLMMTYIGTNSTLWPATPPAKNLK